MDVRIPALVFIGSNCCAWIQSENGCPGAAASPDQKLDRNMEQIWALRRSRLNFPIWGIAGSAIASVFRATAFTQAIFDFGESSRAARFALFRMGGFTVSTSSTSKNAAQDGSQVSSSDIAASLGMSQQLRFTETKLVGSDASVGAQKLDPNLVNPWGVSHGPGTPLWISENGAGLASIYAINGQSVKLNAIPPITIAVPPGQKPGTAAPTGQVFNRFAAHGAFTLSDGSPAVFLFATEDGTISGWNSTAGSQSVIAVDESNNPADGSEKLGLGAVYKGLAIAHSNSGPTLYAANFRHGTVDVYDKNFNLIKQFTDPSLPKGYAPFNVQVLEGKLFVTFALQDSMKHDDVAGAHHGFVDEYDLQGNLLQRVASGGPLDSPWGLAIAPHSFGAIAGDLLVGNFGSGTINAFNLKTDHFDGVLRGADRQPIVIGDLWAITPGGGGLDGSRNALFFTAGVQNEAHGLFGSITANAG